MFVRNTSPQLHPLVEPTFVHNNPPQLHPLVETDIITIIASSSEAIERVKNAAFNNLRMLIPSVVNNNAYELQDILPGWQITAGFRLGKAGFYISPSGMDAYEGLFIGPNRGDLYWRNSPVRAEYPGHAQMGVVWKSTVTVVSYLQELERAGPKSRVRLLWNLPSAQTPGLTGLAFSLPGVGSSLPGMVGSDPTLPPAPIIPPPAHTAPPSPASAAHLARVHARLPPGFFGFLAQELDDPKQDQPNQNQADPQQNPVRNIFRHLRSKPNQNQSGRNRGQGKKDSDKSYWIDVEKANFLTEEPVLYKIDHNKPVVTSQKPKLKL